MMKLTQILTAFLVSLIGLSACKKSNNPYDNWQDQTKDPVVADVAIDPNTIQGLHKNIFKPTCSNSGCHDGNFEPDFRTVESSYNSLVERFSTNTDPGNPQFSKRVVPGNPGSSMILHRMTSFIPGSQGIMPLSVDPGSDFKLKKDEYIANITQWIQDGAKDQFGNKPSDLDFKPQMGGMQVFADGASSPLSHDGYNGVQVPAGTGSIKIVFAFQDDKTAANALVPCKVNFTLNPYQYDSTEVNLQTEPTAWQYKGVSGAPMAYWYSVTFNVSDLGKSGDVLWVRTLVGDGVNDPVYIPAPSTPFNFKKYFTIKIN